MAILISFLLGILFVVICTPAYILFPSKHIKKITSIMDEPKSTKQTLTGSGMLEKIANLGLVFNNAVNVRILTKKKIILEKKLQQAGLRKTYSPEKFYGLKSGMLLVGGVYGTLLASLTNVQTIKFLCYMAFAIAFLWPNMWLMNKINDRKMIIQKEMPFVLSSMAVIVESGLSLMQALTEISKMKDGALVEEFQTTLLEVEIGVSRIDAFERMIERVQVTELSIFLSSLIQSIEKGSSGISRLLKDQSDEMWKKRKSKAKGLAEKASIKLFLPLLLFVLPAMMIFILTPAVLSLITMF